MGAQQLVLSTMDPNMPPGSPATCGDALLDPVEPRLRGTSLEFVSAANGALVHVVWPRGFSARLVNGVAEVVAPAGDVLAREGEAITGLGGNGSDPFEVCTVGGRSYGPAP